MCLFMLTGSSEPSPESLFVSYAAFCGSDEGELLVVERMYPKLKKEVADILTDDATSDADKLSALKLLVGLSEAPT
eukprot:26065-Eustigmatos_ZCMA.PRE.1